MIKEIEELLKKNKIIEAFDLIIQNAPNELKEVIRQSIRNPEVLKEISGFWKNLALLVHFYYNSIESSRYQDNRSLVLCVVSSVNGIKLAKELNLISLAPKLMINAARALTLMDMKDRAERMLLEAEKICEEIKDEEMLAEVENELSVLLYDLNRFSEAKLKIEEAIEIFRKLSRYEELAEALMNAAEIYIKLGDFELAESCFEEAEEIFRNLVEKNKSLKFDLAIHLSNYGIFLKKVNKFKDAEKKLFESLKIFEELEKADFSFAQFVATALKNIADLKREMKEFGEAEKFYMLASRKLMEIHEKRYAF